MSDVKIKNPSPLVRAVLALDAHFSDLVRLGAKIESLDMESNFDFEQAQRQIDHFAKAGQGVSEEVILMSNALNVARARAEAAAQIVTVKAEQLAARKIEVQTRMEEFRELGEKVKDLSVSLQRLHRPEGADVSDEDRARMAMRLAEVEMQIQPLIEKAKFLKKEAQASNIRILEQSADSLGQSLLAISQKLTVFQQGGHAPH
ncbi:MAG TPA: hypothetical protein PKC28_04965 [Bdellovibrionales bacterium]|nr:hypothetical protein [Bdellovibrionales bacterium]